MNWEALFIFADKAVIFYFLVVDLSYVLLFFIGLRSIVWYFRRKPLSGVDLIAKSKHTRPISILVPALNEARNITESVKSLLRINYPEFEVIVINDGSTDDTLAVLEAEFHMDQVAKVYKKTLPSKRIKGTYISSDIPNLLLIDKENGGKADALNAGLNFSRYPLFCSIDADTLLEKNALIRMVKPMLEDPQVIASGGIVRVANGCNVKDGTVLNVKTTKRLCVNFQIIEYLRAFLTGRSGWSALNSLLIISGAFGLFRKNVVVTVGGYATGTVGEDAELVVRLHRYMLKHKKRYKILFITDPICWTEVPDNLRMLLRQRSRWHRGLLETILRHRCLLFNPRYGRIGLLAMPYFLFFELFGPALEVAGYLIFGLSLILGYATPLMLTLFFIVSILFGTLLSIGALFIEEFDFNRYERWRDIFKLGFYAILENFGYRQLLSLWRTFSIISWSFHRRAWGRIDRKGFSGC